MKTTICFFLILTISVATDVKVYVYNGHEYYGNHSKPAPRDLLRFGYHSGDILSMQIYLNIKYLNVSADLYIQYRTDLGNIQEKVLPKKHSKGNKYFEIRRILNDSEITVDLEFNTTSGLRTRKQIVKGIVVKGLPPDAKDMLYNDICTKSQWCVIEVDLLNNVNVNTEFTAPSSVLIYVIPSVIVMCVIILVIYLSLKKKCHHNSRPVETMELNTYATNEVVYADLSLVRGDTQPPRRDEESPYAEIIAVVKSH